MEAEGRTNQEAVASLLAEADEGAPPFWEAGEHINVRTDGADLRVIHCAPSRPCGGRPVVLVPGFGVIPEGFQEFYRAVHGRADFFYVETREKASSRLSHHADMSIHRMARDLAEVLPAIGLGDGADFVLTAVCWGATIALEGLMAGNLHVPTLMACDPMHALYFPRWFLRWVSPVLPLPVVRAMRPLVFAAMLGDMREPVQKQRARDFVYSADVAKWKRAAEAARDVELCGRLHAVAEEVFVLNGTADKVHDPALYPLLAAEMPRGRFLFMETQEHLRERLFGTAALAFSRVRAGDGLPAALTPFERALQRQDQQRPPRLPARRGHAPPHGLSSQGRPRQAPRHRP